MKVESITGNKIKLTLVLFDAEGEEETITRTFKPGDDIAKLVHDDRLHPLGTVALAEEGGLQKVLLTNTSLRSGRGPAGALHARRPGWAGARAPGAASLRTLPRLQPDRPRGEADRPDAPDGQRDLPPDAR